MQQSVKKNIYILCVLKTQKANINSIDDRPSRTIEGKSSTVPIPNAKPQSKPKPSKNQTNPPVDQVKLLQMAEFELGNCECVCVCVCVEEEEKQTNRQRKKSKENKMHKMLICG